MLTEQWFKQQFGESETAQQQTVESGSTYGYFMGDVSGMQENIVLLTKAVMQSVSRIVVKTLLEWYFAHLGDGLSALEKQPLGLLFCSRPNPMNPAHRVTFILMEADVLLYKQNYARAFANAVGITEKDLMRL